MTKNKTIRWNKGLTPQTNGDKQRNIYHLGQVITPVIGSFISPVAQAVSTNLINWHTSLGALVVKHIAPNPALRKTVQYALLGVQMVDALYGVGDLAMNFQDYTLNQMGLLGIETSLDTASVYMLNRDVQEAPKTPRTFKGYMRQLQGKK